MVNFVKVPSSDYYFYDKLLENNKANSTKYSESAEEEHKVDLSSTIYKGDYFKVINLTANGVQPIVQEKITLAQIVMFATLIALPIIYYLGRAIPEFDSSSHLLNPLKNITQDASSIPVSHMVNNLITASANISASSNAITFSEGVTIHSLFPEGLVEDSLWLVKELGLTESLDDTYTVNAFFDLSRTKNMRFLSIFALLPALQEKSIWKWMARGIALGDSMLPHSSILSTSLTKRLAIDTSLLGAEVLHYGKAMQKSGQYFAAQAAPTLSFKKAVFLGVAGLQGMLSTLAKGYDLVKGVQVFSAFDEDQKEAVLKHRAVHLLAKQKSCNAVVVDGLSNKWGGLFDDLSDSMIERFYEKCNTQTYRVSTDEGLCDALKKAEDHFGSSVDYLLLAGHGNGEIMMLNKGYYFNATNKVLKCLDRSLKPGGQIILSGCNSAVRDHHHERPSLTERISAALGFRTVTGTQTYLSGSGSLHGFTNNTFSYQTFIPFNSKGELVVNPVSVNYQEGIQL